ncbi:DUF6747 family protein [uncultured Maribacter sp.]|uniref:DUF6747 family protein n=1 Tax=uncultured Maribacter sp. TaxID=431308 RepID=UPI0030DA9FF3|tara:strand:- start:1207 stop:1383 length:177 start_codon:yes stop_codon:yes gene_type:complete
MKTVLLVREIYFEGFRNLGNNIIKNSFRAFAWFTIAMYALVLYAFIERVSNGFTFSNL